MAELPAKRARHGEAHPLLADNSLQAAACGPSAYQTAMPAGQGPQTGLLMMMLDAEEEGGGVFRLWGITGGGQRAMVRVPDFQPYFYMPCPLVIDKDGDGAEREANAEDVAKMQHLLNCRLPSESKIERAEVMLGLNPIMYYRPLAPQGTPYLKLTLRPGASTKKCSTAVEKLAVEGLLNAQGFSWHERGTAVHEAEVKLLTRFLCDAGLSCGAWLHIPQASTSNASNSGSNNGSSCVRGYVPIPDSRRQSLCPIEVEASWQAVQALTPDATQLADPGWWGSDKGWPVMRLLEDSQQQRQGRQQLQQQQEHKEPAREERQQQQQRGQEQQEQQEQRQEAGSDTASFLGALAAAKAGRILPLRMMTLDVLVAPHDGAHRSTNPAKDPIVCIACELTPAFGSNAASSGSSGSSSGSNGSRGTGTPTVTGVSSGSATAVRVVFALASAPAVARLGGVLRAEGNEIRLLPTEGALLLAWRDWVVQMDPDALAMFQVRDSLGAIVARFEALRLDGGSLHASRLVRSASRPVHIRSVVQYTPAWVKSQSRMASTSNQETFRAEGLQGRLVFDVLRQVLTSQSLATFSLADCVQSILGETLEVLPNHHIAALQHQLANAAATATAPRMTATAATPTGSRATSSRGASTSKHTAGGGRSGSNTQGAAGSDTHASESGVAAGMAGLEVLAPQRAALRLARYGRRRLGAVGALLVRLATVPESFEMARAAGLTLDQCLYNAQMIRTWHLLLRSAHRLGFIIGGRQDAYQLVESPFLLHPVENRTNGLYRSPVATLDFASLYPSLYRAHNLCYTTLVHKEDLETVGRENCTITPTGDAFVKPSVRQGILPAILSALMTARAATRAQLKATPASDAAGRAVLDGRQRALKLTANALYGFTGAQASMLQCVPLADSCLALGAATCRRAIEHITELVDQGKLGKGSEGGRVIYAQTDSVFLHLPKATPEQAVALGKQAAAMVTATLPPPMELKYERVYSPFLLLHVNRYAGRAFETEQQAAAGTGTFMIKGIKAIWRQSAPFIQNVLSGALERIIMRQDVPGAVDFVAGEVHRLLTGGVEVWELAMTGGLWRVTGQQVEKAAAALGNEEAPSRPAGNPAAAGGGDAEDVKGPHASLAVRLSQRDPDRKFVLGERLSYVLLTGARTQDDAAEDPLSAAMHGPAPNYELYWTNKLQTPLKEIFTTCLTPEQLRQLLNGPHTKARAAGDGGDSFPASGADADVSSTSDGAYGLLGSPMPQQGLSSPGSKAGSKAAAAKRQQKGMMSFFTKKDKCLGCRRVMPATPNAASSQPTPGLCEDCKKEEGKWVSVYLSLLRDANAAAVEVAAAQSQCRACHSGAQLGPIVCENAECAVTYARVNGVQRLVNRQARLERMDW